MVLLASLRQAMYENAKFAVNLNFNERDCCQMFSLKLGLTVKMERQRDAIATGQCDCYRAMRLLLGNAIAFC